MYAIFNIITKLTDAILFPFRRLHPFWGIAFLALLSAFFILWIYRSLSDQKAIKRLKKRMMGYFLGIYIFRDDAGRILKTQFVLLGTILRYLGHSLRPLLFIIIPIGLLCAQMQLHYGWQAPRPGDELHVTLKLKPGINPLRRDIELKPPPGVEVLTPPLRIKARDEIDWKVKLLRAGNHRLLFRIGNEVESITLDASPIIGRRYPEKEQAGLVSVLKYPGQEPLDEAFTARSLRISYSGAKVNLSGFRLHWVILYFLLAVIFAFLLKRPLRVDF